MAKPNIKISYILFGLHMVFLCFLRLWKSTAWFSFNFDEEYQAFLAWSQVQNFHPIWIGVSASNFGFYLGPGFTYLNALLFKLSAGNLASIALFSPVLGLITCLSIYYAVSKLFSKKAAMFSTLIYGFSALMNIFDRRFWNPTPIPFITVWLLFSLYKANKDSHWFILSSILMATALHVHLSLMVFWPLVFYLIFKNFKKISLKTWAFSLASYLLIVSPLIVFDINHNFDNLLGPLRYIFSPKGISSSPGLSFIIGNLHMIWRAFSRLWFIKPFSSVQDEMALGVHFGITRGYWFLSLSSFVIFLWLFIKQAKDISLRLLFLATISILGAYLVYPGSACEYFLISFFTLFSITAGLFLSKIPSRLSIILIGVFIILNSYSILTLNQSRFGLTARTELIGETLSVVKDSSFSVETAGIKDTAYPQYAGWCFLYRIYGRIPGSCPANAFFGWIIGDVSNKEIPNYRIVITEDFENQSASTSALVIQKGAYKAYLYKEK